MLHTILRSQVFSRVKFFEEPLAMIEAHSLSRQMLMQTVDNFITMPFTTIARKAAPVLPPERTWSPPREVSRKSKQITYVKAVPSFWAEVESWKTANLR